MMVQFQFHKGTIRTPGAIDDMFNMNLFQFHKGTIRTTAACAIASFNASFQFHKGTIRTFCTKVLRLCLIISIP